MLDDLGEAITPRRVGDTRFAFTVHPGWAQGRGAFGGIVLGAMVRAIETVEPERERKLRSLTGELVGPTVVGECELEVIELRRGTGVSSWHARLTQDGSVTAIATAVLGKTREIGDRSWTPHDREPVP